ncbi:metal-dependent transcriptional regulator [Clavibacter nebraskensis]
MERDGLVIVSGDRHLELTPEGRSKAVHVMRKHRLAERLLSDVIGLEWEFVHDEACRWEHVMSEQVERKILDLLGHPTESPYGNPIPGLDELGDSPAVAFMAGVVSIVEASLGTTEDAPARGVIRRLGEPVQFDPELLSQLKQAGVLPGATGSFSREGAYVLVRVDGAGPGLELPLEVAGHIFIER